MPEPRLDSREVADPTKKEYAENYHKELSLDQNLILITAQPTLLYGINRSVSAITYLKIHDCSVLPQAGRDVLMTIKLMEDGPPILFPTPIQIQRGLAISVVNGANDADSTNNAATGTIDIQYR